MPATAERLLDRLTSQVNAVQLPTSEPAAQALAASWRPIATASLRVLDLLATPATQHPDRLTLALNALLIGNTHGRGYLRHYQLLDIAETIGTIADYLTTAPPTALTNGLIADPHTQHRLAQELGKLARASLATLSPPDRQLPVWLQLRRIEAAAPTETHLISTHQRHHWVLVGPDEPGLLGAVTAWANVARDTLNDPARVTGLAFQLVAANISHILGHLTHPADAAAPSPYQRKTDACRRAWLEASRWPENLRLGGRTPELRHASAALTQALDTPQTSPPDLRDLLGPLLIAGEAHATATARLNHEGPRLWIRKDTLPQKYLTTAEQLDRRTRWVTLPREVHAEQSISLASAHAADSIAHLLIDRSHNPRTRSSWEVVTATRTDPTRDPATDLGQYGGRPGFGL